MTKCEAHENRVFSGSKNPRWVEVVFLEAWRNLPKVPCCYAIYFDGQLKYIGSTSDLRNRFSGHAFRYGYAKNLYTPWGSFGLSTDIRLKYSPSKKYGDWLMREARLIRRLQPEFNVKLKGRRKPS